MVICEVETLGIGCSTDFKLIILKGGDPELVHRISRKRGKIKVKFEEHSLIPNVKMGELHGNNHVKKFRFKLPKGDKQHE